MSANNKKYKLHAANGDGDGKPKICAFFNSEKGCRNGDRCKFAHEKPTDDSKAMDIDGRLPAADMSLVSSESGEVRDLEVHTYVETTPGRKEKKKKRKKVRDDNDDEHRSPFYKPKEPRKVQSRELDEVASSERSTDTGKQTDGAFRALDLPITERPTDYGKQAGGAPFRALNLPVADFRSEGATAYTMASRESEEPPAEPRRKGNQLPLPESTEFGRRWLKAVVKTQENPLFAENYDFKKSMESDEAIGGGKSAWIKAKPFGDWCKNNPQVIAIDCEMCETEDPVSTRRNPMALCRVSVIDAVTDEILLNSLVKPEWPVVDYRTHVNGIDERDLEACKFTVRHCQAFLMALCSEETVIVGQGLEHDLKTIRMEHYCIADTALLFSVANSDRPNARVSLRDLALAILDTDMPRIHDSVNDARVALRCAEHYLKKGGDVEPIEKHHRSELRLFVHRIPPQVTRDHIAEMLLANTKVAPDQVKDIEFGGAGKLGKTWAEFRTERHAALCFETLRGKTEDDNFGKPQKRVYLKGGSYIWIRKN